MRSILGIDTASPRGSIALLIDGVSRGVAVLSPGGHSSGLATLAARLTADAGIPLASLAGIGVSEGPGSFTGLRIGLAWAKGIAVGAGTPLALVSAHEGAAHAALSGAAHEGATLFVTATPGERKEVEVALWAAAGAPHGTVAGLPVRPHRLHGPESVPEDELTARIESLTTGRAYVALPANDAIAALLEDDTIPYRDVTPLALSVAIIGDLILLNGGARDVALAAPAYGRAPNARKPTP